MQNLTRSLPHLTFMSAFFPSSLYMWCYARPTPRPFFFLFMTANYFHLEVRGQTSTYKQAPRHGFQKINRFVCLFQ